MSRAQMSLRAREEGVHTRLMLAALEGRSQTVKALLNKGVAVNAKDGSGRTALMFAVINLHAETVKILLDHGADVNVRADDGGTALMLAAVCGDAEIVQSLLDKGATLNGTFVGSGLTAIELATLKGFTGIVRLLQKSESRNCRSAVSTELSGQKHSSLFGSNQSSDLPAVSRDTNIA